MHHQVQRHQGWFGTSKACTHGKGDYSFEVLRKRMQTGSWKASEAPHREISGILDTLLASSGYVLCPGIRDYDSQYGESIRFKSKNLRIWTESIE